jgi:hypothetical protein
VESLKASGEPEANIADTIAADVKEAAENAAKAADADAGDIEGDVQKDVHAAVNVAESRKAALEAFIANSAPVELLHAIEEQAKVLMHLIHGIPAGIQHGWHSLAAEISARKL